MDLKWKWWAIRKSFFMWFDFLKFTCNWISTKTSYNWINNFQVIWELPNNSFSYLIVVLTEHFFYKEQGTPYPKLVMVKMFKPIPSADEHDLINDPSTGYANYFPTSPDGDYAPYCTWCFEYYHNKRFRSTATSLKGFAYIINSDYELNPISVGTS